MNVDNTMQYRNTEETITAVTDTKILYLEAVVGKCSSKKSVLKNFAIFKRKHLCWSQACNFVLNIATFLRTASFIEPLWRLLLLYYNKCCQVHPFLKCTAFKFSYLTSSITNLIIRHFEFNQLIYP